MPDLGLNVLLKGKNAARLLGGLWVAMRISLISVVISIPLGILLGVLMSGKNPIVKAILRVYLEIIRWCCCSLCSLEPPVPGGGISRARQRPSSFLCCGAQRR